MKKIIIVIAATLLSLAMRLAFGDEGGLQPGASMQTSNQATQAKVLDDSIIKKQRQKIEILLAKIDELTKLNFQQNQLIEQLQGQVANLGGEVKQLSVQNLLLQNTSGKQEQTLSNVEKMLASKQQTSYLARQHMPSFTAGLLKKTQRLMLCIQGDCQFNWQSIAEPLAQDNVNQDVLNELAEFGYLPALIAIVLIVLILILVLLIIYSYSLSIKRDPVVKQTDTSKDNLDFVSGEDLYASKLDLARAYIDMEDYHSAKKVLIDVLNHGTPAQQAEANRLLSEVEE